MLTSELKYIGIQTFEKPVMQIDIDLSNHCNYSCSYCGPYFNGGTSSWQNYKKIISLVEAVQEKYPNVNIFLQLKGGEPTQWPDLNNFLDTISTYKNIEIGIITNLSRTKRFWKDLNFTKVSRVLGSFHAAQADSNQFIENAKVLWDNGKTTNFSLLLLMDKPYFRKIIKLVNETKKLEPPCNELVRFFSPLKILLSDDSVTQYNNEEEEIIRNMQGDQIGEKPDSIYTWNTFSNINKAHDDPRVYEQILQSEQVDYRGWICYAGIRKLMINSDGDIYVAQCKINKLGNINTTWKFNDEPVTCTIRNCACLSDIQIPKHKPDATLRRSLAGWTQLPKAIKVSDLELFYSLGDIE